MKLSEIMRLSILLEQMDVPETRRDTSKIANVRWLSRNLGINNADHPMFESAMKLVITLLRSKRGK